MGLIKKSLFRTTLSLILGTSFLACTNEEYVPTYTIPAVRVTGETIRMECQSENGCPESAGGLYFIGQLDNGGGSELALGVCSQTLIDSDKVLTNQHCLPTDEKGLNHCRNLKVFFPATEDKPATRAGCKNIIAAGQNLDEPFRTDQGYVPDWAILQLDKKISRKPATVNTNGIKNQETFKIFPSNFTTKLITGEPQTLYVEVIGFIDEKECKTNMASRLIMAYNSSDSALVGASCDDGVENGNSGGGMYAVSEDGGSPQISGVMSYGSGFDFERIMGKDRLNASQAMGSTNLQCVSYFNKQVPQACDLNLDSDLIYTTNALMSLIYGQKVSEENQIALEDSLKVNDSVRWKDSSLDDLRTILEDLDSKEPFGGFSGATVASAYYFDWSLRFPKFIDCISKDMVKKKSFEVQLPRFSGAFGELDVSTSLIFEVPLNYRPLVYDFSYDENSKQFVGNLQRLEDEELKSVQPLWKDYGSGVLQCFFADNEKDCEPLFTATEQLQRMEKVYGDVLNNEEFIDSNAMALNPIKVPVCPENAGA